MKKTSEKDPSQKGLLALISEDLAYTFSFVLRGLLAVFIFGYCIFVPASVLFLRALSLILYPFSEVARDAIGVTFIFTFILFIAFKNREKPNRIVQWIMTGQFQFDISDESNRKMRILWLKIHRGKERTKPMNWHISLSDKFGIHAFETVYELDKYGHKLTNLPPVCFRTMVTVTHKFAGNLPVAGDIINFTWTTTSNNDIKKIRVKAVEYRTSETEEISPVDAIIELDEKYAEGTVCAENIRTGQKTTIKGTVKLSKKVHENIYLMFWYQPSEAEGESVFRLKF